MKEPPNTGYVITWCDSIMGITHLIFGDNMLVHTVYTQLINPFSLCGCSHYAFTWWAMLERQAWWLWVLNISFLTLRNLVNIVLMPWRIWKRQLLPSRYNQIRCNLISSLVPKCATCLREKVKGALVFHSSKWHQVGIELNHLHHPRSNLKEKKCCSIMVIKPSTPHTVEKKSK